jgi:hypothetical protein
MRGRGSAVGGQGEMRVERRRSGRVFIEAARQFGSRGGWRLGNFGRMLGGPSSGTVLLVCC